MFIDIEVKKKKFPLEHIEKEIDKIEKFGYVITAGESGCQIWKDNTSSATNLLIDADFYDDYHSNVADALYCFYFELK